ncbi:Probable cobalt transporter subunit (CbtA) [Sphingomonas sp. YR710]|uniref:CbtA family protein n=1 Tax=Sphingomonas sp. YR710 TaxID=1882773 RepID=UPI00088CF138|nr:CbtA family protein [Sphingomonas sp. YR710]SDC82184.1 Probable cobalt transporter subunit (CbtA) [Sphingomonas sp. YR710]
MVKHLLLRGMIAGVLSAILAMLFARLFGEPGINLAIAYEHAHEAHEAMGGEPEIVSRATQAGLGLLTALAMYGAAIGGFFALIFAFAYGRIGRLDPRNLAILLAIGGFVAVALIPALKYPPTPPAVGQHETVAFRTAAYFGLILLSLTCLTFAANMAMRIRRSHGTLNAMLALIGIYGTTAFIAQWFMPAINEVPADFPAVVLWDFRVSAIGMQAVLWAALGVGFGLLAAPVLRSVRR